VAVVFPLTTERLAIRPFTLADRPAMAAIYADPEVMRHIDTRGEDPATWVAGYVAHQAAHGWAFWAVADRATGELLGEAGFGPFDGIVGASLELGYLLRRDAWGRGLATEAARACLDAAFDGLGATEVRAVVDVGNDASLRVARKLGFRVEGWRVRHGRRQHVLRLVAGAGGPA
jgi:ribosomal-protein-alanine N-acetyltransferase